LLISSAYGQYYEPKKAWSLVSRPRFRGSAKPVTIDKSPSTPNADAYWLIRDCYLFEFADSWSSAE